MKTYRRKNVTGGYCLSVGDQNRKFREVLDRLGWELPLQLVVVPTVEVPELSQSLGVLIPEQSSFQEGNHDESTFTLPACGLMQKASASKENNITCFEVDAELQKGKFEETLLEVSKGDDNL